MYLQQRNARRSYTVSASERQLAIPKWDWFRNGTMETFAYRQRFTTLHQPLEKLRRAPGDASMERFLCTRIFRKGDQR